MFLQLFFLYSLIFPLYSYLLSVPDECKKQLSEFEVKEEQGKDALEKFRPAFSRFKSWAEEFENATLEQKKMIAGQLFRRVEVGKGYKVHIVMNMTYQQFCEQWQSLPELTAV